MIVVGQWIARRGNVPAIRVGEWWGGKMMTAEAEADKQVMNSQTDRLTNRTGGDGRGEGV